MENLGLLIVAIIGGVAGLFSSLYIIISLPVVLIWKFYRRITKGISVMK